MIIKGPSINHVTPMGEEVDTKKVIFGDFKDVSNLREKKKGGLKV